MRDQDSQTLRDRLLEQLSLEPPPPPPTELERIGIHSHPRQQHTANQDVHTLRSESSTDAIKRQQNQIIDQIAERLNLGPQLDIPMIALSNGQQRRARILRQLIKHPRVLLLENPFAGLDVIQRPLLSTLLQQLHSKRDPVVLIELRPQDPVPEWTTHVALIEGQRVQSILADEYRSKYQPLQASAPVSTSSSIDVEEEETLVSLKGVRVGYGKREVRVIITLVASLFAEIGLQGPQRYNLDHPKGGQMAPERT
jgi:ABC-type uncharacterized transport system ATPase subunit